MSNTKKPMSLSEWVRSVIDARRQSGDHTPVNKEEYSKYLDGFTTLQKAGNKKAPDANPDGPGFTRLTDDSPMPYGVHIDTKMKDVPAHYLIWLSDNDKCSKPVRAYITDHWDMLQKQAGLKPKEFAAVPRGNNGRRL